MDTKRIERAFLFIAQLYSGYTELFPTIVRLMHDHSIITHLLIYHRF